MDAPSNDNYAIRLELNGLNHELLPSLQHHPSYTIFYPSTAGSGKPKGIMGHFDCPWT